MLTPNRQEYDVAKKRLDNARQLIEKAGAIIEETAPVVDAYTCSHMREIMAETFKYEVFLSLEDDGNNCQWVPIDDDLLRSKPLKYIKRLVREKRIRRLGENI